jgi:hypothetical protein
MYEVSAYVCADREKFAVDDTIKSQKNSVQNYLRELSLFNISGWFYFEPKLIRIHTFNLTADIDRRVGST